MVTTFYPPYHFGGDAVHVYRLSQALAEQGHRVDVVHSIDAYRLQNAAEPDLSFAQHANVTVHPLETRHARTSALAVHQLGRPAFYERRLRQILEDGSYDVIHFHNVSLIGGPRVLALGSAVKLYTAHEYWLVCPTHSLFEFDRHACVERRCLTCTVLHYRRPPQLWRTTGALTRALKHVDRLITLSRFSLEKHRALGVDRPMVELPYCGSLGTAAWPDDGEAAIGVDLPRRPFFLYVGRLERLKGVDDLIQLFRDYRAADLVLVGAGSREPELRRRARDLPHVHFVGTLHPSALPEVYRRAIAVLLPSLCYETFGLTLAESLTCGTPVVARRIGAFIEHLDASGGGFGFDDLAECRRAMERLRLEPDLRAAMGRRGQLAAQRLWSSEALLPRYLDLVESLLPPAAVSLPAAAVE
jgi:glycosyltransferase involved in cell wall biosynthesis